VVTEARAGSAAPATHRRVQRVPETWPTLHLEADVPGWAGLEVDGLVRARRRFDLGELQSLGGGDHDVGVHCVWGWSRPEARWRGISMAQLLDAVGVDGQATHVIVESASDTYSSCLPLADAQQGVLAWSRDGAPLAPDAGGPLRYVGPSSFWGYKGVKWAARVHVTDHFVPGFWESKVADPVGRIPAEVELP
jgi:DMSO/TMAO reductase YedYZ molybdopterin-dependent catalytic subunit